MILEEIWHFLQKSRRLPGIGRRLPGIGRRLPGIGRRLPGIGRRLPGIGRHLPLKLFINCEIANPLSQYLNESKFFSYSNTTASNYMPKKPRICIN